MKLQEFLRKHNSKKELKLILKKERHELFYLKIFNKNNIVYKHVILLVDKNKNIIKEEFVKKGEVKEKIALYKKHIKKYILDKTYNKIKHNQIAKDYGAKDLKSLNKTFTKYNEHNQKKYKKIVANTKFKNENQKKDLMFVFIAASWLLDYLRNNNAVDIKTKENGDEIAILNEKIVENEYSYKFIYRLYDYLKDIIYVNGVQRETVKYDIMVNTTTKIVKKIFNGREIPHYIVLSALYLLVLWKNVKYKELILKIDFKTIDEYIEGTEEMVNEEYRENSQKIAHNVFYEIYGEKIATKQESKKLLKKLLKKD